jgi:hypothetical protein
MFDATDSVFNNETDPSNISYKSFKTSNLPLQNSYCDHRNFDRPQPTVSPTETSIIYGGNSCWVV